VLWLSLVESLFFVYTASMVMCTSTISVEVEREVPLPKLRHKYPYEQMEVGESFFVPGMSLQVLCNSNYWAGKKYGRKFIARCEKGGIRVWRLS
jgi:hypothetical protein